MRREEGRSLNQGLAKALRKTSADLMHKVRGVVPDPKPDGAWASLILFQIEHNVTCFWGSYVQIGQLLNAPCPGLNWCFGTTGVHTSINKSVSC